MSKSPVPTPVSKFEVERICAMGPADSPVCQQQRERLAEWQEYERMRDVESARIRAARERRQEQARQERVEQDRQGAEDALQGQLRTAFLSANPSATEADFTRLYPRLREDHLIREARRDPIAEEATTLARRYGRGRLL